MINKKIKAWAEKRFDKKDYRVILPKKGPVSAISMRELIKEELCVSDENGTVNLVIRIGDKKYKFTGTEV